MNTKQLISLCTNQASSSDLHDVTQFLPVIKSQYISAIRKHIFKLFLIELILSVFFGAITRNFTLSLFSSIYPFLLLILIGYGVIIVSQFIHLHTVTSNIQKALVDSSNIFVCPDCYTYEKEDSRRIGNDASSESVQSFCFRKTDAAYGQRLYVGKNNHNCFFDSMEKSSNYKIYAVSGCYILFIRAK